MFFASKDHDLGEYELSGEQINLKEIRSPNGIRKICEMCVAHYVLLLTSIPIVLLVKSRRNIAERTEHETWWNITFEKRMCRMVTEHQMNN